MEQRPFGSLAGDVAVIGQGTWYIDTGSRAGAVAALRQGIDLGMTHIDTAEMYGDAEEIVGEALEGRREGVFLVSKVVPQHASREGTLRACEQSLRRLKTDHLDTYLLHWPGRYPLEETFGAFDELRQAGKIRAWGVSNFDVPELEAARRAAGGAPGDGRLVCNQVLYHLQERAIEHAVLPWCQRHGVAVVGYSPFGHDRFPAPGSPGGRVLGEVAAAHGATPRQVALRFLVRRPALFTIPKAAHPQHVAENGGAGDLRLTPAEEARVDAAFPLAPRRGGLPML